DRTLLDGQINVSTDHCRCTLIYMFSLHDALPISMATLLANAVALAAILAWLRHRRHPLWIGRGERHLYRPDWAIVRTLVTKGVPMGLQMVLISMAMIAMITMVNQYGTHTTAAYGAALQLWTYVQM